MRRASAAVSAVRRIVVATLLAVAPRRSVGDLTVASSPGAGLGSAPASGAAAAGGASASAGANGGAAASARDETSGLEHWSSLVWQSPGGFVSASASALGGCVGGRGCVPSEAAPRGHGGFGGGFGASEMHVPVAEALYYEQSASRVFKPRAEYLAYVEDEYSFGVVADLDLMSRDPQEFIWRSFLKKGRVVRKSGRQERDRFELAWDEELELRSSTATRNRSMELSELVRYDRILVAFCDYSGIVYKIDPVTGKTFQRWAIADGNGDETKPFKAEWATIKDNAIWLGSIGFEWYGADGQMLHRNAEWIKTIDESGLVRNLDWHPVYQTIRTATNTTSPGFLWHEAVEWEPTRRVWVMLPRFSSSTSRYIPGTEHDNTCDLLVVANEGFTSIRVTKLKHHDPRFGFTSVRRLPGSHDLFMVLRVHEDGNTHRSQAAILDLDGGFYTDPPYQEVGSRKFEGLAFF